MVIVQFARNARMRIPPVFSKGVYGYRVRGLHCSSLWRTDEGNYAIFCRHKTLQEPAKESSSNISDNNLKNTIRGLEKFDFLVHSSKNQKARKYLNYHMYALPVPDMTCRRVYGFVKLLGHRSWV